MLFASTIGQIGHPFYVAFAWLLAAIYSGIPNYAIAIALLTLIVMVIAFPITLKQTRGMMKQMGGGKRPRIPSLPGVRAR